MCFDIIAVTWNNFWCSSYLLLCNKTFKTTPCCCCYCLISIDSMNELNRAAGIAWALISSSESAGSMSEGEGSQTTLLLLSLLLATGMTERLGPLFKHGLLF